jgi:hypothetical protein
MNNFLDFSNIQQFPMFPSVQGKTNFTSWQERNAQKSATAQQKVSTNYPTTQILLFVFLW